MHSILNTRWGRALATCALVLALAAASACSGGTWVDEYGNIHGEAQE